LPAHWKERATHAQAFIRTFIGSNESKLDEIDREYEIYSKEFALRIKRERITFFDPIYDLGSETRYLVFTLIRVVKPSRVLETGIAAGASSNTFLTALSLNGFGILESVDITPRVGELVDVKHSGHWKKTILKASFRKAAFIRLVKSMTQCKIFVHDSNHSPSWQIFEFETVYKYSPSTEFFIFDDITNKLLEHVERFYPELKVTILDENRKYAAIFSKPNSLVS